MAVSSRTDRYLQEAKTAWRRVVLPPPAPAPSPVDSATARALFVASAIVTDFGLLLAGGGAVSLRAEALRSFVVLNCTLLALDLVITLGFIRRGVRFGRALLGFCVSLEVLASVVWVHFTGVVSSYFIFFPLVLVLLYRLSGGYWIGVGAFVSAVVFHVGAFALERMGIVAHAPLLADPSTTMDARSPLALVILISIDWTTVAAFGAANLLAWILQEKDAAIRAVRDELRRALSEGRPGELVGRFIADRYRLTEFLGRGGMGDVYKAADAKDRRDVALKMLHLHLGADPKAVARFRREVDAARRLVGARVPEVLGSGTTEEGVHFFAMEWLRGEDLAALLRRRGRLPLAEVQVIADQLAEVLDTAHAAGIIHRDVKPQNVFLVEGEDGSRSVHLLDFGIAALQEAEPERQTLLTSAILGTPGFLAPEQILPAQGAVGPQTDVFAMGAVLYRLLTGRAAFDTTSDRGAMYAALHATPAAPSRFVVDLPDEVDLVFVLALAKRPANRYRTARAFAEALRDGATGAMADSMRVRARALIDPAQPTRTHPIDDLAMSPTLLVEGDDRIRGERG